MSHLKVGKERLEQMFGESGIGTDWPDSVEHAAPPWGKTKHAIFTPVAHRRTTTASEYRDRIRKQKRRMPDSVEALADFVIHYTSDTTRLESVLVEMKGLRSRVREVADLRRSFESLADQWEAETRNISSPKRIAEHPKVQEIIKMGDAVVPLILRRMRDRPWFWFDALTRLEKPKVNPVKPSMCGNMQRMTEAWIKWGVRRGFIK